MRGRSGALVAVLATALVGCMGGESPFTVDELPGLVLQSADLSDPWSQFDEGRQVRGDAPVQARADPARFGRLDGWKARYRQPGAETTRGPLVIESRADLFKSEAGAQKEFEALEAEIEAGDLFRSEGLRVASPDLGDESIAATLLQGGSPTAVRYYLVAWRQDNLTASILINGFDGVTTLDDAVALARKQQLRIAARAG